MPTNHQKSAIKASATARELLTSAHNALIDGDYRTYSHHCKRLHSALVNANTHAILAVTEIKRQRNDQSANPALPILAQNSATH